MAGQRPSEANVVDMIYDSVEHDEGWSSILDTVASWCEARYGWLLSVATKRGELLHNEMSPQAPSSLVQAVPSYLVPSRNELLAIGFRTPAQTILSTDLVLPRCQLEGTRIYKEMMAPHDSEEMMVVNLVRTATEMVSVSVFRSSRCGAFGPRELARLGHVSPHLGRALRLRKRLDATPAAAFDRLRICVLQLDQKCRVVFSNTTADDLLRQRDGLSLVDEELVVHDEKARKLLRKAIDTHLGQSQAMGWGDTYVSIPRLSEHRPLIAVVTTPRNARHRGSEVILFVVAPPMIPVEQTNALRSLWGLTTAEAKVCLAVARGRGLKDAAASLRISVHTAHTHLMRSLNKTGTRRQAELVALLLSSVGMFHEDV